ncbi:MAG: T9SS type A sorting domain-containing protein, partial [Bacteroidetes bacterium]|nr:T9SS type A sorting domain-containing protein [Bacteroidota bacterium]
ADSLPGTYAGQYWYANPATSSWVITQDTEFITNIDSTNCILYGNGPIDYSLGGYYCTNYYSCNSCTYTLKFYNGDSIHAIYDNMPQPFPDPPISKRFYGKRISSNTVGVYDLLKEKQISIYPNPVNEIVNIDYKVYDEKETEIIIIDLMGRVLKIRKLKVENRIITIDVSDLKSGIYFLKIHTNKEILAKKIIKK